MGERAKPATAGYEDGWHDGRAELMERITEALRDEASGWADPTARTAFATALRIVVSFGNGRPRDRHHD